MNASALGSYLRLGYVAAPKSIFERIEKLAPATLLSVENARIEKRRYWRIPQVIEHGLQPV